MVSFKRSFSVYFLSNFLAAIVPFLLIPYLTRVLSPTEYGVLAVYASVYRLSLGVVGSTFVGAINREFFENGTELEYQKYISSGFQLSVALFILSGSILLVASHQLAMWLRVEPFYIGLAFMSAFFKVIYDIKVGQLQIRQLSVNYAAWQISKVVVSAVLTISCIEALNLGVDGRVFSLVAAEVIFFLVSFFALSLNWRLLYNINRENFRALITFGLPLIPHVLAIGLLAVVDRIVIANVLGLNEAGIYLAAMQIAMVSSLIFDGVNKAYVPWLYERLKQDDWQEKVKIVRNTYIWFFTIIVGVMVGLFIKDILIDLILGDDYTSAKDFIGWIFIGMAFKGMYLMVTNYCFYAGKTAALASVSLIVGGLYLILLWILVNQYGLTGASIAFASASFLRFCLVWMLAGKFVHMPWLSIWGRQK